MIEPSDYWTFGPSNLWKTTTFGLSNLRNIRTSPLLPLSPRRFVSLQMTASCIVRCRADQKRLQYETCLRYRTGQIAGNWKCVSTLRNAQSLGYPGRNKKTGISLHQGETLANVSSTYLSVCLSETLEWEARINKITSKVNSTLGFFGEPGGISP